MEFDYDSWNRIQHMTYPDGEVVSYGYNKGGMLQWVSGEKNGSPYPYINDIRYNKFELKESVEYGNGTVMTYDYDQLQRLEHLESQTSQQETMQDIVYEYDGVGNILTLKNMAGMLNNGLGGMYNNGYFYDNLYRLTYAVGSWSGHTNLSFEEEVRYYSNGRIYNKTLDADIDTQNPDINSVSHISYDNYYHYDNVGQPNTLTSIESTDSHVFEWDATGNMVLHQNGREGYDRHFCWDEANRLQGVVDDTHQSFYQYDANGERTYKLTTSERAQLINGNWNYYTVMDNATLYASPYLVATPRGYTKHYYAENERIASKIGMGGLIDICQCLCPDMTLQYGNSGVSPSSPSPSDPSEPSTMPECEEPRECFYEKPGQNQEHSELVMGECLGTSLEVEPNLLTEGLYSMREVIEENEQDCYWYHPDHLGSSSWITYSDGSAVQHLHYLPWGEDFVDQRSSNWNAMYTFSAKEKDTETGYSYFGSRYYSSDLSIWLSVDPMSDKYPSLSPYVYCANNPIKLVDPNGEDWFENELTGDVYYSKDYRKGDEKLIDGEGWKWMGENDMFGKSADEAIAANIDKADVYTEGNSYDRVGFSGDNAKGFMANMGYDFMPSKLKIDIEEYQQMMDFDASGAPIYSYNQVSCETVLSSKYIPKNATSSYTILNTPIYIDKQMGPFCRKSTWTEIRQYNYSTSTSARYKDLCKQMTPIVMEILKDFVQVKYGK